MLTGAEFAREFVPAIEVPILLPPRSGAPVEMQEPIHMRVRCLQNTDLRKVFKEEKQ